MIQIANSKVYCKLGNGTVRDLTLDTNTVYTHPTTKQCSGGDAGTLNGKTAAQIINESSSWQTVYDDAVTFNDVNQFSNTARMISNPVSGDPFVATLSNILSKNPIILKLTYYNANAIFTLHREWSSNGTLYFGVVSDTYNNYTTVAASTISNPIKQDVQYPIVINGEFITIIQQFSFIAGPSMAVSQYSLYAPSFQCIVSSNSADKRYTITGTVGARLQIVS